jgi:hypothetical protein
MVLAMNLFVVVYVKTDPENTDSHCSVVGVFDSSHLAGKAKAKAERQPYLAAWIETHELNKITVQL